jgi:SAM-dependent methyltransferase
MPNENEIPLPDSTFDVVISGQVIEHVRQPWRWMAELTRISRPGGLVITISPVSWPYHEAPIDCWRIYPEGMRAILEQVGLTVELCLWDSLEPRPRRWYPGKSYDYDRSAWARRINRVKAVVGWPLPVAFVTITVARKSAGS